MHVLVLELLRHTGSLCTIGNFWPRSAFDTLMDATVLSSLYMYATEKHKYILSCILFGRGDPKRDSRYVIPWLGSVLLVGIEYVAEVRDGLKGDPMFLM